MTATLIHTDTECFRSLVSQRLGLYFEDSKLDFLADVARKRMEDTGCKLFSAYRNMFSSAQEMRAVAERLTVCETYFFRYADHFRAFTEAVVPARMQAKGQRRQLRILSAGCASGEEAYSLAILIRDGLPDLASWDVTIQGIDVNASMVKKAQRAHYTAWSLRDTPDDFRMKRFRMEGHDFVLDNTVKSMVTFEERNLIEEDLTFWQRDAFDVVFCRNVTMYFTPEAMGSVIARIARSLAPGGFLFLGHAETLRGISQDFHLRHTHETFYYQRRNDEEPICKAVLPWTSAGDRSCQTRVPALIENHDSWFDVIRRASERIATLTNGSGGAATSAPESADRQAPHCQPPVLVWDSGPAIELLRVERFAEAIDLLRGLPPGLQTDADVQLLLAVLLTNHGNEAEAERVCLRLLTLDELNAGAHYLMALCREHAGDRDKAVEHDRAAIYLDSTFAMPHLHLGLVAKRFADLETAKRELGWALTLLPREDASRILFFGGGFTREALSDFCRAELRACGGIS